MKSTSTRLTLCLAAFAAFLATATVNLRAATITVTSTADSGAGTLRAALASANTGDTINFALPTPTTILLTSGELLVSKSVSILGPGANNLAVDGNAARRVFHVASNTVVTLASLTVTNGSVNNGSSFAGGYGGGVWNDHAMLTVSNCTLSHNSAVVDGGGIWNNGASLVAINSTLSGNSERGILNDGFSSGPATIRLTNCTLSANTAGRGGGIGNVGCCHGSPTAQIVNTTITGNSATQGGGISNEGYSSGFATLSLLNSTLIGNSSGILNWADGGGTAVVQVASTILANSCCNYSTIGCSGCGIVTITSLGYNLISDSGSGFFANGTDQINTSPKLGPLQDNGGPTLTQVPLPGSPAIDRGKNFGASATDQCGFARTLDIAGVPNAAGGDGTHIGAVESQDASLRLVNVGVVSNQFGFNLTGPFADVVVEASTNAAAANWIPLATNTLGDAALRFNDPTPPTWPRRFYRARVQ